MMIETARLISNPHKRSRPRRRFLDKILSSRVRLGVLCAFLLVVFLTGGSSRADMQSLVLLRPISMLALGYGLLTLSGEHVRNYWPVVVIVGAFVTMGVVHLIPLPPALWQSFSGREAIRELDTLLGLHDQWRPLTLDPQATRNALLALMTPCAVLVLAIQLGGRQREALLTFVLGLGALTAIWGLLQLIGSSRGPLYIYSLTSYGSPVGLFANRNHQAVFLASLIPLMYGWTRLARGSWKDVGTPRGKRNAIAMGALLLLVPLLLITGSRAGLLTFVLSLSATAAVMALAPTTSGMRRRPSRPALGRIVPAALGVLIVAGLGVATIGLGRDRAFGRLIGTDSIADMRADLLPVTWEIALDNFPWGTGLGSFDDVYRMYEPDGLLMPEYLNHAHNDFLEVLMTGGLAGTLILILGLVLFFARTWTVGRGGRAKLRENILVVVALIALGILFVASLIDYPLRVPAMAGYAVLLTVWATRGPCDTEEQSLEDGLRTAKTK